MQEKLNNDRLNKIRKGKEVKKKIRPSPSYIKKKTKGKRNFRKKQIGTRTERTKVKG